MPTKASSNPWWPWLVPGFAATIVGGHRMKQLRRRCRLPLTILCLSLITSNSQLPVSAAQGIQDVMGRPESGDSRPDIEFSRLGRAKIASHQDFDDFHRALPLFAYDSRGPRIHKAESSPAAYDVIIRNGRIVNGSGNQPVTGDVAIRGDRIAAIGALGDAVANRVIDASGLVVAPGFIDMLGQSEMA